LAFAIRKGHRIAKANQIRGLVTEYGLVAPLQLYALRRAIPEWLEEADNGLTFLLLLIKGFTNCGGMTFTG